MYVRNFNKGWGLPWQIVFQTNKKQEVDEYCRRNGIETEWIGEDRLRTRAIRTAVAKHPRMGALVWFNHATFFHVSTLNPAIRHTLINEFSEEDMPTNTYYGDGSPIEAEVLDQLRDAYNQEMVIFPWQERDVLMLDNMLVAHGRMPYTGARSIQVGMAEPNSCRAF
jgi:hypothetical protein